MYKVSKKIIKKDEKLSEFFRKTKQELSKVDDISKRVKKDIENNLISEIFKDKDDNDQSSSSNKAELDRFSSVS